MQSSFTPGPWPTRESATHVTVTNARGDAVFHDDKRIPGVMADARLIASAPELLEALRGMLALDEEHHQRGHCDDDVCAEVRKARAAIAKATGGDA